MRLRLLTILAVVVFSFGLIIDASANDSVEQLARSLASQVAQSEGGRPRVTVLDFTDIHNRTNELGRYLALQLANELVMLKEVVVLDRANLETILSEHQLTAEGLLRPEDAKKLGQFAGVDAILIGTVSLMSDNVESFVRAISTDSSEIVAASKASFPATDETRRMLGVKVDRNGTSGQVRGSGDSVDIEAIAVRDFGPLRVSILDVVMTTTKYDRKTVPAVKCIVSLENRDLGQYVAVALHQHNPWEGASRFHDTSGYLEHSVFQGQLLDSNDVIWTLAEANGVYGILGFTISGGRGNDKNAANSNATVDYIRSGKKFEVGISSDIQPGKYWTGSFVSILPGENIKLIATFVPTSNPSGKAVPSLPDYFQLNVELLLGTHAADASPTASKDLQLRTLSFERVNLSQ